MISQNVSSTEELQPINHGLRVIDRYGGYGSVELQGANGERGIIEVTSGRVSRRSRNVPLGPDVRMIIKPTSAPGRVICTRVLELGKVR